MEKFELHILGCGSATPTTKHFPASQVLNVREKLYMIDCGEGAQLQLRRSQLKFSRLGVIFISHLHGDHFYGLIGLISTFNLHGRTFPLHVYSPPGLSALLAPMLEGMKPVMTYDVVFHEFPAEQPALIYEDRSLTVETIPLRHCVPTCGFLFKEQPLRRHILREMTDFYGVPVSWMDRLKNGEDYVTGDGAVIPNSRLTSPPPPPRSFAYCSDTAYHPAVIPRVRGVNLLYHEATFASCDEVRVKQTMHSTAAQAASIARDAAVGRLVIGHFSARYDDETILLDEARAVFPATELARENVKFDV